MNVNNWVDRGMFLASFACKNPLFLIFCRDSRRKERLDDLEVSWNSSGGAAIKVRNESTKERQIPPKLGAHSGLPSFFAPYASDRASFFVPLSPTPVSFLRIALRLHG